MLLLYIHTYPKMAEGKKKHKSKNNDRTCQIYGPNYERKKKKLKDRQLLILFNYFESNQKENPKEEAKKNYFLIKDLS